MAENENREESYSCYKLTVLREREAVLDNGGSSSESVCIDWRNNEPTAPPINRSVDDDRQAEEHEDMYRHDNTPKNRSMVKVIYYSNIFIRFFKY